MLLTQVSGCTMGPFFFEKSKKKFFNFPKFQLLIDEIISSWNSLEIRDPIWCGQTQPDFTRWTQIWTQFLGLTWSGWTLQGQKTDWIGSCWPQNGSKLGFKPKMYLINPIKGPNLGQVGSGWFSWSRILVKWELVWSCTLGRTSPIAIS